MKIAAGMRNITIDGYNGEWHAVERTLFWGKPMFLLLHQTDENAGELVVNENGEIVSYETVCN